MDKKIQENNVHAYHYAYLMFILITFVIKLGVPQNLKVLYDFQNLPK